MCLEFVFENNDLTDFLHSNKRNNICTATFSSFFSLLRKSRSKCLICNHITSRFFVCEEMRITSSQLSTTRNLLYKNNWMRMK